MPRLALILTAALGLLSASASVAQENPSGPWRHPTAGMVFPEAVGDFKRVSVTLFDRAGDDAGVGYNLEDGQRGAIFVTVFVYPLPRATRAGDAVGACEPEFQGIVREVLQAHPDASGATASEAPDMAGAPPAFARGAAFRYMGSYAQGRQQLMSQSRAILYCPMGARWFLKYRATWPEGFDGEAALRDLIGGLPWAPPSRPQAAIAATPES